MTPRVCETHLRALGGGATCAACAERETLPAPAQPSPYSDDGATRWREVARAATNLAHWQEYCAARGIAPLPPDVVEAGALRWTIRLGAARVPELGGARPAIPPPPPAACLDGAPYLYASGETPPPVDDRPLGERLKAARLAAGYARPIDLAAAIVPDPALDALRVRWARDIDTRERDERGALTHHHLETIGRVLGVPRGEVDAWLLAEGHVPTDVHLALRESPELCALVRRHARGAR
jgi:hypothetical protein